MSIILAPFAGWCAPLDEVPDAAFAKAMLGDGVAIDPVSPELRAPCDGEIISVAAARHALALRSSAGAEILLHVGIDTVALGGEGFQVHVRKGDRVRAGDPLLTIDLDRVARTGPKPHDAGDHHQRRALPDPQREPPSFAWLRRHTLRA